MKVRHQQFGIGTVVRIEENPKITFVVVRFEDKTVGTKTLTLGIALLEPNGMSERKAQHDERHPNLPLERFAEQPWEISPDVVFASGGV